MRTDQAWPSFLADGGLEAGGLDDRLGELRVRRVGRDDVGHG
jgi:hypothetical protein